MTDPNTLPYVPVEQPPITLEYRLRRGRNWFVVGLTYASYYVNRYNLGLASKAFTDTFGFSNTQLGLIFAGREWAYGIGQFVNGLFADRVGGKRSMAIGGYGTALLNVLFGLGWYYKTLGPVTGTLAWFVAVRSIDGYVQAFGAPGMVKMNTAWFARAERGQFAGIFGLMINLGRVCINLLAPALLAGFTLWNYTVPKNNWQWVFFVPAGVVTVVTTLMLIIAKNTPEEAGFHGAIARQEIDGHGDDPLPLRFVFRTITRNPIIWLCAGAYFCTGVVRYGIDNWFARYFEVVQHVPLQSFQFQWFAVALPIVATLGSIVSGFISDLGYGGRRAPVAMFLYFLETIIILIGAQLTGGAGISVVLLLTAFTCNSTHSILGTAAAMDAGGRKMAGFAAGVIDSLQYFGASLASIALGALIDRFGWGAWLYFMAGFGVIGGAFMLIMMPMERRRVHYHVRLDLPSDLGPEPHPPAQDRER